MNLKETLSVFLAFLFLLASLSGCAGNGDTETAEPDTPAETTEAAPAEEHESVTLISGGVPAFNIVRNDSASDAETEAAKTLYQFFKNRYPSSDIKIDADFKNNPNRSSETVDILVGKTFYDEAKAVIAEAGYGDGVIRITGNKVVITAWQTSAVSLLVSEFISDVTAKLTADPDNLTLTDEDNYTMTVNKTLGTVPYNTDKDPDNVVSVGDGAVELVFAGSTQDSAESYIQKLTLAGYRQAQKNAPGNNVFYTYTNDETCVTVSYTPFNKLMRVIAEPVSNYYNLENSYTATVTPLLTMIGRKFSNTATYLGLAADSGLMCFVIRLSDGRFIVIDGGVADNGISSYSQAIYAKMLEQASDRNNIVIAAWIITHSHSDHIGGFRSFSATYSGRVTLQSIIYNFPSDADHDSQSDETADYTNFKAALGYWTNTPAFRPHTGQVLEIADAKVTFWYTQEDFVTKGATLSSAGNKNWNNTSLAFSVDIAGERIFFLGDCQEYANNLMANCFGSELKSDIVQMAHHGGIGGTEAIYRAIDAEIGLFTTTDVQVPNYISKWAYNNFAVNKLNMKEYWNSDQRIKTWSLPYHATGSGFMK